MVMSESVGSGPLTRTVTGFLSETKWPAMKEKEVPVGMALMGRDSTWSLGDKDGGRGMDGESPSDPGGLVAGPLKIAHSRSRKMVERMIIGSGFVGGKKGSE